MASSPPIKIVETGDPDVFASQGGSPGCIMLFGLPFFLAGVFTMLVPFGIFPIENHASPFFLVPFGLIFAAVGLGLIGGRSGVMIDRRHKKATKWYGLFVPMKRIECELGDYNRITITKHAGGKNHSILMYPIKIEGEYTPAIEFMSPTDYQQARQFAEQIAAFVALPVMDSSSGKEVRRDFDKLDESIRDKVQRGEEKIEFAPTPMNMRSTVREEYGAVIVEIPGPGFGVSDYLRLGAPLFIFAMIGIFFIGPLIVTMLGSESGQFAPIVGGVALLIVIMVIYGPLKKSLMKTKNVQRITASKDELIIEERNPYKSAITKIPTNEIEEFEMTESVFPAAVTKTPDGRLTIDTSAMPRKAGQNNQMINQQGQYQPGANMSAVLSFFMKLAPKPTITARSDKVTIQLGKGVELEELKYIHAALKKALTQ